MNDSSPLAYLRERICELDVGAFLHCTELEDLLRTHGLGQGSPNYGPRAKSDPRRHFANEEKQYNKGKFVDLAETFPETITFCKMSGPRTVE